ncbi:hypothetical protein D3C87_1714960 [compost metagenome]
MGSNTARIAHESRVILGSSAAAPATLSSQFCLHLSRRVHATSAARFASFHSAVRGTVQIVETLTWAVSPTA